MGSNEMTFIQILVRVGMMWRFGAFYHPLVISNYLYLNFSHGHEFFAISRVSVLQDNLPEVFSFYTYSNLLTSTPHQALHSFSSIPGLLVWPVHCKPNPRTLHGNDPGQLQHKCKFSRKYLPIHPKPTMHKNSSRGHEFVTISRVSIPQD